MTNLKHNNRTLTKDEYLQPAHRHIKQDLSSENMYLVQRDLKRKFEWIFGPAVEKYNERQKRSDRKIKDYYLHVKKSKTLDVQREFIVAIGSKDDWDNRSMEEKKQVAKQVLARYLADFHKRNYPRLQLYNAVVHLDESGAPHLHFNVIPVATGYKKGLEIQPSFRKALENLGYTEKGRAQLKAFRDVEVKQIEKFMNELGIERKEVGTNAIKDMREYKRYVAEVEELKQEVQELKQKHTKQVEQMEETRKRTLNVYNIRNGLEKEVATLKQEVQESNEDLENLSEARKTILEGFKGEVDEIAQEVFKNDSERNESLLELDTLRVWMKNMNFTTLKQLFMNYGKLFVTVASLRNILQEKSDVLSKISKIKLHLDYYEDGTLGSEKALKILEKTYYDIREQAAKNLDIKLDPVREKVEERKEQAVKTLDETIRAAREKQKQTPKRSRRDELEL